MLVFTVAVAEFLAVAVAAAVAVEPLSAAGLSLTEDRCTLVFFSSRIES